MGRQRRVLWCVLLVGVIGCAAALRTIAAHTPADADAAAFSYFASEMAHGKVLYRDLAEQKPPVIFWINLIPAWLAGGPPTHALESCVETLFLVAFSLAYYRVCRHWLEPVGAMVALLLATIYVNHPAILEGGNLPETYGLTFQCLGFLLALRKPTSLAAIALSGLLVVMAAMTKQSFGLSLLLVPLYLIVTARNDAADSAPGWRRVAAFGAGAVATLLAVLLPAAARGTLADWWHLVAYVPTREYLGSEHERKITLVGRLVLSATRLSIPATLMVLGLVPPRRRSDRSLTVFAVGWFLADLVGAVSSPFAYPHYFLQIVPSAALLATIALVRLSTWARDGFRLPPATRALALVGAVGLLCIIDFPSTEVGTTLRLREQYLDLMAGTATNDLQQLVETTVSRAGTPRPHDVLVWGNRPRIYEWTHTRCPDRYPARSYLFSPTLAPEMLRMTAEWLDRYQPRFFIVSNSTIPFVLPSAGEDEARSVARVAEPARQAYRELTIRIADEYQLVVDAPNVGGTIYARKETASQLAALPAVGDDTVGEATLEIVATGTSNPASQGSEVWVALLAGPNGPIDLSTFEQSGEWERKYDKLVSYQHQPATLRWHGTPGGNASLRLVTHPYSGIAEVRWNGTRREIDLYSPTESFTAIDLPTSQTTGARDAARIAVATSWRTVRDAVSGAHYAYWLSLLAIFMVLERLRPAQRGQSWRGALLNVEYMLLYLPLAACLAPWFAAAQTALLPERYQGLLDVRFATGDSVALLVLSALLTVFIGDAFYYWMHRLQHRIPILWEQHKLHHSDESVNVSTAHRHHWLEEPIRFALVGLPLAMLLKANAAVGGTIGAVFAAWGSFIHANLRIDLGYLTPVIGGPQYHRIHHSVQPEHLDKNFAAFFPIFDLLFGTYVRPEPNESPTTGLTDRTSVTTLWDANLLPFRGWRRMLQRPARARQTV